MLLFLLQVDVHRRKRGSLGTWWNEEYTMVFMLDWTWVFTAVIGLITLVLVRHFLQIRSLPPGPFPLPVLGNLLELRGKGNEFPVVLGRLQKKYKDIFCLWLGPRPTIFICDWDLCHEALILKRNDFAGRVRRHTLDLGLRGGEDVALADFNPTWETLRKVMATAVRKYAVTEHLAELVADVVDRTADDMLKEKRPVDSNNCMYLIIYNIIASSAFGQRFEMDDPKFTELRNLNEEAAEKLGVGLPSDALPFLRIFYRKRIQELMEVNAKFLKFIDDSFYHHVKTYQSGDIRDFTDAILAAREEAEKESKESLNHLTEINMINTLADLFGAGTDTTRVFLLWIFLLITYYPELQKKMQDEIDKNIGNRMPVQKDKLNCPYVTAVMTEMLRFRPVIDFTLEHKTICDTEIAGYKIPKDTSCLFYIKGPHQDPNHWDEPEKFKPERFLDSDGKFTNTRMTGYMPFGLGRRACPGEKLALADAFLVIARLLQNHNFELEGGASKNTLEPEPKAFSRTPYPYKLIIKKKGSLKKKKRTFPPKKKIISSSLSVNIR